MPTLVTVRVRQKIEAWREVDITLPDETDARYASISTPTYHAEKFVAAAMAAHQPLAWRVVTGDPIDDRLTAAVVPPEEITAEQAAMRGICWQAGPPRQAVQADAVPA